MITGARRGACFSVFVSYFIPIQISGKGLDECHDFKYSYLYKSATFNLQTKELIP